MLKTIVGGWANATAGSVAFITQWNTANAGTSTSTQITVPTVSTGTYACTVYWGDGTSNTITTFNDAAWTHTFPAAGIYTVRIVGTFIGMSFNNTGDPLKLLNISSWGSMGLGVNDGHFFGCANLTITSPGKPDLTGVTSLSSTFRTCSSIRTIPNLDSWDISAVTNLSFMFTGCALFNQSVNSWNTSSVTTFRSLFSGCTVFNQNLNSLNTSAVQNMQSTFFNATAFNGNISSWNVSQVTIFSFMFSGCSAFNQNVGSWNVSAGIQFNNMFQACAVFNQNLSSWNVSLGTDFTSMFQNASMFNSNISSWNTASAQRFQNMFASATSFNQNIGSWIITNLSTGAQGGQNMFSFVTLSNANYNGLLAGWGAQVPNTGVIFSGGLSHYDTTSGGFNGTAGRAVLTGTYSWTITDGGTP
jgi:surface protein